MENEENHEDNKISNIYISKLMACKLEIFNEKSYIYLEDN